MFQSRCRFLPIILLMLLFNNRIAAQTTKIEFRWINPNPYPVTFNVYKVLAPPNNSTIVFQVNHDPIPDLCDTCSWSCDYVLDDKINYFRMEAVRYDTLRSVLSNTASIFLIRKPICPQEVIVDFKKQGEPPWQP